MAVSVRLSAGDSWEKRMSHPHPPRFPRLRCEHVLLGSIPTPTFIKLISQAHIRRSGASVVVQRLVANTRLARIILQLTG
jgi:hypothetical protein